MQKRFSVQTTRQDVTAYLLPRDYGGWEPAVVRAIKRVYGPHADAWSWQYESREENSQGETVAVNFKATILGKKEKSGNSWPILGEVRVRIER